MKNKKTLIIYYVITLLLSIISLYSFKNKGNDFFTATASLTADFTLIISIVLIVYALFICLNFIKEKIQKKGKIKKFDLNNLISLLILTCTLVVVFISFINIFSHKDIFEFIKNTIDKKENIDLIKLFIESCFIYYFIYLAGLNGIIISKKYNEEDTTYMIPTVVIISVVIISLVLMKLGVRLIYFITIIDVILYITAKILISNKKVSK